MVIIILDGINGINRITIQFGLFIAIASLGCVCLCGCQPGTIGSDTAAQPGKPSIQAAVETLTQQRQQLRSLYGIADCTLDYKNSEGQKKREPVDGARIYFIPPDKLYFRGLQLANEVFFGSNENEFWVRIEPMDSYWWGMRGQIDACSEKLPINPDNVTDAFGVIDITTAWKLTHKNGYDILSLFDGKKLKKRVLVEPREYRISRIEYFDNEGLLKATVDLSDYSKERDGVIVPMRIELSSYHLGVRQYDKILIELTHVAAWQPNDKQRQRLFKRPARDGYGHLYRLNDDCEFIEE